MGGSDRRAEGKGQRAKGREEERGKGKGEGKGERGKGKGKGEKILLTRVSSFLTLPSALCPSCRI
jgi:hypothetical protein